LKNPARGLSKLSKSGAGAHLTAPEGGRAPRDRALPRRFPKVQTQADFGMMGNWWRNWGMLHQTVIFRQVLAKVGNPYFKKSLALFSIKDNLEG